MQDYILRNYQNEGVEFWDRNRKCCLWFDMGLGKTLTALHALSLDRSRLPALIVAPLRVARFVWPIEIDKFGFDFTHNLIWGRDKVGQLLKKSDIKIINPDGLKVIEQVCRDRGCVPFNTVIVDESSLFKNPASKRWKSLRAIINDVPNRLLLTGTPLDASYAEIWAQMNLLGPNRLGSYRDFLEAHFGFDVFGRAHLKAGHAGIIERAIRPVVLRKRIEDEIDMPELTEIDEVVEMPKIKKQYYDDIESGIEPLAIEPYSPLRTMASGFVYENHWSGTRAAVWHGSWKYDRLAEIIEESRDKVIVMFNFRAEREQLVDRFGCRFVDGGSTATGDAESIAAWNRGDLSMLAMHARSAAHGLNLQSGGRRMVWLSLPDSQEVYSQAIARLWRSGQKHHVIIHRLTAKGTIDEAIAKLLAKKALTSSNLMAAMQAK